MAKPEHETLLAALDRAFDRRSWHGTNLRGSLRGLKLEELAYRPQPGRHNIWELALHCAYWKYAVRRKLTGGKRGSFPLAGSDFFPRPEGRPSLSAWKEDLRILEASHHALRAAVSALRPRELARRPGRGRETVRDLVLGVAAHDLYHAGQIQLLKRMAREAGRR